MSTSQPSSSSAPKKVKKWDYRSTYELLKILTKHHKDNKWENGSFKKHVWNEIDREFIAVTGLPYQHSQILNRWKELKRKHTLYSQLLNKSGWGIDPISGCSLPVDPSVWDELPPELAELCDKPFIFYEDVHKIVDNETATGEHAMSSTQQEHGQHLVEEDVLSGSQSATTYILGGHPFTTIGCASMAMSFDSTTPDDIWNFVHTPHTGPNPLNPSPIAYVSSNIPQPMLSTPPSASVNEGEGSKRVSRGSSSSAGKRKRRSEASIVIEEANAKSHEFIELMRTLVKHHIGSSTKVDPVEDTRECMRILHMRVPAITPNDLIILADVFMHSCWRGIFKDVVQLDAELGAFLHKHVESDYGFF